MSRTRYAAGPRESGGHVYVVDRGRLDRGAGSSPVARALAGLQTQRGPATSGKYDHLHPSGRRPGPARSSTARTTSRGGRGIVIASAPAGGHGVRGRRRPVVPTSSTSRACRSTCSARSPTRTRAVGFSCPTALEVPESSPTGSDSVRQRSKLAGHDPRQLLRRRVASTDTHAKAACSRSSASSTSSRPTFEGRRRRVAVLEDALVANSCMRGTARGPCSRPARPQTRPGRPGQHRLLEGRP